MTKVLESLNSALHQAFSADERVYLLGEDVLDPYGGAFKVTSGLSTTYPDRVLTTPVSEASIVGVAAGMALRGLFPVVEIMFGDFVTLIADQLINHVAKFRWMYNDQVRVPIVIRTPMGGRRGYGPTHSQSLEKLYLGIPGLRILAPTIFGNPGDLLIKAILEDEDPVLFIENKLQYLNSIQNQDTLPEFNITIMDNLPTTDGEEVHNKSTESFSLTIQGAPQSFITLVAYGHMAELARQAVKQLAYKFEIFVELIVPTQLAPFQIEAVLASVQRTGRLLVVEEGTRTMGWGAEIIARTAELLGAQLLSAHRVAALDLPIPASGTLEASILPSVDAIIQQARKMV
jgi:pyruvate/2-oxoglutarate/acetoin dehydrogenase E1 component